MKKFKEERNQILIENGYFVTEKITLEDLQKLPESEQDTYSRNWNNSEIEEYTREVLNPELTDEQIEKIQSFLSYKCLDKISKDTDIIKKCVLFFTILTAISIIISVISAVQLAKFF